MSKSKNADNVIKDNAGIVGLKASADAISDPKVMNILQQYSSGGTSLQDALKGLGTSYGGDQKRTADLQNEIKSLQDSITKSQRGIGAGGVAAMSTPGLMGMQQGLVKQLQDKLNAKQQELKDVQASAKFGNHAAMNELFSNPLTGTQVATEQIQNNPLLASIFGKGGLQEQLAGEQKELSSRGYSLKPEDYEAYGQASDEIARQFGQEESSLAKSLAARGMASGASGSAGVAYSGLMGSKLEQLAAKQRQIADDRMKMNQQRLNDVRNLSLQTNAQAQAAVQGQYARNREGVQDYQTQLKNAASAGQMEQGQENTAFEQRLATAGPSLGDIVGGVGGNILGAATGGLGSAIGGKLGDAIFNKKPNTTTYTGVDNGSKYSGYA